MMCQKQAHLSHILPGNKWKVVQWRGHGQEPAYGLAVRSPEFGWVHVVHKVNETTRALVYGTRRRARSVARALNAGVKPNLEVGLLKL